MPRPLPIHPLQHHYRGYFSLRAEDTTMDSTHLPFLFSDQNKGDPESIMTNPMSESITRDDTASCYMGSTVYKFHLRLYAVLPVEIADADITAMLYRAGLIQHSFEDLTIADEAGSNTVGSLLKIKQEDTNEDTVHPDWSGTDLDDSTTLDASVPGLTTNQQHESVAFNRITFDDHWEMSSLRGKLRKCMPNGMQDYLVYKDRPVIRDVWLDVPGAVQRMNKGTYWGALFDCPQEPTQLYLASETDATKNHMRIHYECWFNEFNEQFDSTGM